MPYCSSCGSEIQPSAAFCSKCGAPTATKSSPTLPTQSIRPATPSYEKQEKREKAADRSSLVFGGAIPVLLGFVLLAAYFDFIEPFFWWTYFFIGIGIMLLFQALYRYRSMKFLHSILGLLVAGPIFLFVGVAGLLTIRQVWPFVILLLILSGILIIIFAARSRSLAPRPPI